jgi:hypothetical protein
MALAAARALHDATKEDGELDREMVAKTARVTHREIKRLTRELHASKVRAVAEQDALRAAIHGELIDVAANQARVADRQRILFQRSSSQAAEAYERAVQVPRAFCSQLPRAQHDLAVCAPLATRANRARPLARQSAAYVEGALLSLSPHLRQRAAACDKLHPQAVKAAKKVHSDPRPAPQPAAVSKKDILF